MATNSVGKTCTLCNEEKPPSHFNRSKHGKDGLASRCRACTSKLQIQYRSSPAYIALKKARESTEEHKARQREHSRKAREKYPEKVRARMLLGWAVRLGYIEHPPERKWWYHEYQFHHVDYSRPYYGCWVTKSQHNDIEHRGVTPPPPTDYGPSVAAAMMKRLGLSTNDILAAANAVADNA